MSTVQFTCEDFNVGVIPEPTPAFRRLPDYYKNIAPSYDNGTGNNFKNGTVKKCIPFIDAMSQGFIISMPADVLVVAKGGDLNFYTDDSGIWAIATHNYEQIPAHPRADMPYGKLIWKFINPWTVITNLGYSCVFTAPLNHMETRFKIFDGVVDTDTYKARVHFPFIWTGGEGEFTLKKGTPLAQVIPFKREGHKMTIGVTDKVAADRISRSLSTISKDAYKRLFWNKRKDIDSGA